MNRYSQLLLLIILYAGCLADTTTISPTALPTAAPQPIYHHAGAIPSYISHETYPYPENFDPNSGYEGYLIPANSVPYAPLGENKSVTSSAKVALYAMLKVLAKVGLFLLGGVALLVVGGIFTTAVCSLTPICTITFNGFNEINKDAVRSYMTPERVANAAAFVEKAVDKFQRIQRSMSG